MRSESVNRIPRQDLRGLSPVVSPLVPSVKTLPAVAKKLRELLLLPAVSACLSIRLLTLVLVQLPGEWEWGSGWWNEWEGWVAVCR